MKRLLLLLTLFLGAAGVTLVSTDADARRLGGGANAGMKRSLPAQQKPATPPQQPAQPANANPAQPANAVPATGAAAAAQAAPRRSWLGPVAGLAAGLGLAALASHFGFGAELANAMMLALLAIVAFIAIRFVMARVRGHAQPQGLRYAGGMPAEPNWAERRPTTAASMGGGAAPMAAAGVAAPVVVDSGAPALPPGFDTLAFEQAAKLIFIRMQAANDAGDLQDLRAFTTPEMFAVARLDLQNRVGATQRTDVVRLAAEIADFAREDGRDVVSVRYHGLLREEAGGAAEPFDEVWHLVRPSDASRDWAIAGIQQSALVA
jgi:predicted lipid-binding transport protein (Tim44 family)